MLCQDSYIKKINLPEVQGGRAVRNFLRAVSTIIPEFPTYWINDISKTKKLGQNLPDLFRIVELFRNHRRHLAAEKGQTSQSAFTTTFQGQSQEGNRKKRDYLCGEPHRFKDRPYLSKEKRPTSWKPDQDIQERINAKIENPRITRETVDREAESLGAPKNERGTRSA